MALLLGLEMRAAFFFLFVDETDYGGMADEIKCKLQLLNGILFFTTSLYIIFFTGKL